MPNQDQIRAAIALLTESAGDEPGPTVADLWERFAALYRHRLRSWRTQVQRWELHVGPYFAARTASALTREDAEAYRDRRRAETVVGRERPTTPATRNREVALLVRVLNAAVENGHLTANPLHAVEPEQEAPPRQARVRSEDELRAILAECDPPLAALVLALIDSGMRRLEMLGLRWDELDADRWVTLTRTKTTRPRRVRLSVRAYAAVDALPRLSPWIFASRRTGRPIVPDWMLKRFKRAVERAGVVGPNNEPITLHTLRHAFAYNSRRRAKLPEQVIMKMGGWRTRSAFDRYGISDEEETDEAWNVVDITAALTGRRLGPRRAPPARKMLRAAKNS